MISEKYKELSGVALLYLISLFRKSAHLGENSVTFLFLFLLLYNVMTGQQLLQQGRPLPFLFTVSARYPLFTTPSVWNLCFSESVIPVLCKLHSRHRACDEGLLASVKRTRFLLLRTLPLIIAVTPVDCRRGSLEVAFVRAAE